MKRFLNLILILALTVSVLLSSAGCTKEYETANFTVLDASLREVEIYDYIGKPIVLNFWATWCYYCKIEMPHFDEAAKKYPDVQFMMVDHTDGKNETVEKAAEYIAQEGYTFPVFYDTTLGAADAYGIEAFPTTFFIDSDGRVVASREGAMSAEMLEYYISKIR
jgi:thiol-disulfide isomerase/thioredoxin